MKLTKATPNDKGHDMTHSTISASVEKITPELAAEYLKQNKENRSIRDKAVAPLMQDMLHGNWKLTGEAIKFDTEDKLIDGQHRLTAVERSGIPVEMMVIRGVQPEAQLVLDTGMKRTGANALEISLGGHEATLRAAIAAIGITDDAGKLQYSNSPLIRVTHSEIIDWVRSHDLENAITYGARMHRLLQGSKSSLCYAYYKIAQVNEASAQRFFDEVADLNTTGPGDPKHTLVNKINKSRDSFRGTGYRAKYVYHVLRAWESDYMGQELRLIRDNIKGRDLEMPNLSRFMDIPKR